MPKKAAPRAKRKKSTKKARAAAAEERNIPEKHQLHLHNLTKSAAEFVVSAKDIREEGIIPPESEGAVRVFHAKRYRVNFWKPGQKRKQVATYVDPTGSAVYTGRKIVVTHPH